MARLIYLMGPSGAGKDSLLAALRADADRAP
ncbi:ribose 1,5-bisphosphokinase, partial [Serratia marcescens]